MKAIILIFAAALGFSSIGCTVSGYARPASATITTSSGYYQPMYHDGRVVYYDDGGAPYYYEGDRVQYVPRNHASFNLYVGHYNKNRSSYKTWHRNEGPRYRKVYRNDRRHAPPPRIHRRSRH